MVVLNNNNSSHLDDAQWVLKHLWDKVGVVTVADGAASRLLSLSESDEHLQECIPDAICGDLDSADAKVKYMKPCPPEPLLEEYV
jgi:thiamine pyrophosphokinase